MEEMGILIRFRPLQTTQRSRAGRHLHNDMYFGDGNTSDYSEVSIWTAFPFCTTDTSIQIHKNFATKKTSEGALARVIDTRCGDDIAWLRKEIPPDGKRHAVQMNRCGGWWCFIWMNHLSRWLVLILNNSFRMSPCCVYANRKSF